MAVINGALRAEMGRTGTTNKELARHLGVTENTFGLKLNATEGRDFNITQAAKMARYLTEKGGLTITVDTLFPVDAVLETATPNAI